MDFIVLLIVGIITLCLLKWIAEMVIHVSNADGYTCFKRRDGYTRFKQYSYI